MAGERPDDVPLVLEPVTQLEYLDLDLSLPVVFQDGPVGLSLAVLDAVQVSRIGCGLVARTQVRQVALHVAAGARATRRRQTDVGRHEGEERREIRGDGGDGGDGRRPNSRDRG